MQILGKRCKILLIAVAIAMLAALGLSFALWDTQAVKASSGDLSQYANAKVGDVITFGRYYQTGNKDKNNPTEYEKTPIEWLVVDKDERSGQLTLLSRYILASGSFFGNWYFNSAGIGTTPDYIQALTGRMQFNQAYNESTVRAYLNNLERHDLGGDDFISGVGYVPSKYNSDAATGKLLTSVGFSNSRYYTNLKTETPADKALVDDGNKGFYLRPITTEIYYQRPIDNIEFKNRPATRGFYDEAFTDNEKSMIIPKNMAGYTGFRWPTNNSNVRNKSYVNGVSDKVWLPSITELNVMDGHDWNGNDNDAWTVPSDEASSTVFELFKNYSLYTKPNSGDYYTSVDDAVKTVRTTFARNSFAMNYSIPVYNQFKESDTALSINTDIHSTKNSIDYYWTRSPVSYEYNFVRTMSYWNEFNAHITYSSDVGVRPGIILKY